MKKNLKKYFVFMMLGFLFTSCSTLRSFDLIPTLNITSFKISSLDLEGMTFEVSYRVDNTYPIDLTIKSLELDVLYFDELLTEVRSVEPVRIRSKRVSKQSFSFKIPYDKMLNFTKNLRGKDSVNCTLNGGAYLDYGSMDFLNALDPKLPVMYTFNIPLIKPSFSVSNFKFKAPSLSNINAGFTFDVKIEDKGSSSWECELKNCSLTDNENNLIEIKVPSDAKFSSSNSTVTMTAELNPVTAASFIAKLLKKEGSNPIFTADADFLFLNSSYNYTVPLKYTKELQLKDIKNSDQ